MDFLVNYDISCGAAPLDLKGMRRIINEWSQPMLCCEEKEEILWVGQKVKVGCSDCRFAV